MSNKDQIKILKELNLLCEDPSILKIFHNAKYDSVILKRFHVNTVSFQDTLLMSFFINNGLTKHNLEDLYYYYFGEEKEKFKDVIKNESKRIIKISLKFLYKLQRIMQRTTLMQLINYMKRCNNKFLKPLTIGYIMISIKTKFGSPRSRKQWL